MRKKHSGAKTAGIVIVAALLVFGVLLAAFLSTVRRSAHEGIVLPDAAVQPQPPPDDPQAEALFLQVTPQNVQQALQSLQRPQAYHQVQMVTVSWDGGSAERQVEIWRSESLARVQITQSGSKRYVLTDGVSAWVWYDAEQKPAKFELGQTRTLDDLTGIASFETVLGLDPDAITDASFAAVEDLNGANCVYVKTAPGGGYEEQYWIDTATQLLSKATFTLSGALVYELRQTTFEQLSLDDATLQALFMLPDGTRLTAQ